MITGDHPNTAAVIANDLGIASDGRAAVTGAELQSMSDEVLAETLRVVSVYARVNPEAQAANRQGAPAPGRRSWR